MLLQQRIQVISLEATLNSVQDAPNSPERVLTPGHATIDLGYGRRSFDRGRLLTVTMLLLLLLMALWRQSATRGKARQLRAAR